MVNVESNIAIDLIFDLTSRSGLGNEWDQIDEDTQREIMDSWQIIIRNHLAGEKSRMMIAIHELFFPVEHCRTYPDDPESCCEGECDESCKDSRDSDG